MKRSLRTQKLLIRWKLQQSHRRRLNQSGKRRAGVLLDQELTTQEASEEASSGETDSAEQTSESSTEEDHDRRFNGG